MIGRRLVAALACMVALATSAAPYERGRLFRIDRPGSAASYVFGTLHSNDPRVTNLPPEVVDALSRSRAAAFETLFTDRDLAEFFAAAQFDDGRKLTDHVDPTTLASIREALGPDAPDMATLLRSKPWAALLLLAQAPLGGEPSLDLVLKSEARRRNLSVFGLELFDEQVAALDAIPLASQVALLRWALATRADRGAELEAVTAAWLAGDLAKLDALARRPRIDAKDLAPHFEALMRHLIVDRTAVMAHRLHLPLARGAVFVAVGALHLYGDRGLLAALARNGYRIRRVLRRARRERSRGTMTISGRWEPDEATTCRTSPTCVPSIAVHRSTSATSPPTRSSSSRAGSTRQSPPRSPKSMR